MSGVFEKFPALKYVLTESGCAWAPALLAQMDRIHMGMAAGAIGELNYGDQQWVLSDRKSTRLNSSHVVISYAVFCLKKKK